MQERICHMQSECGGKEQEDLALLMQLYTKLLPMNFCTHISLTPSLAQTLINKQTPNTEEKTLPSAQLFHLQTWQERVCCCADFRVMQSSVSHMHVPTDQSYSRKSGLYPFVSYF